MIDVKAIRSKAMGYDGVASLSDVIDLCDEVDRLRALLQHPQIHNDGTVPVSARWFGRILKEQENA